MQFIQVKERFNQFGINTFDRHSKGGYAWSYEGNQYRRCNLNDCLQWIRHKQEQREQNSAEVNREGFWYFAKQQRSNWWKLYKIPCSAIPDPGFLGVSPNESSLENYFLKWVKNADRLDRWIDENKPESIICEEVDQDSAITSEVVLTA